MNKKWIEKDGAYRLFFTPYGSDIEYAVITQDQDGDWIIVSVPLKIEFDNLNAENLDAAKEEVEDKIRSSFENEIAYYENLLELFGE